ncbi:hypothetical protein CSOJ01_10260 [Colletotrichum sojae]|uniref:Uncharacterized protein n=1 Tax=Colletotrichum sojae TaxID=2175907 RepID=A0A8H6J0N0_9PEZI|nr:hypothetical protein CSOJ01_10260 [Colletotrichum sojae]
MLIPSLKRLVTLGLGLYAAIGLALPSVQLEVDVEDLQEVRSNKTPKFSQSTRGAWRLATGRRGHLAQMNFPMAARHHVRMDCWTIHRHLPGGVAVHHPPQTVVHRHAQMDCGTIHRHRPGGVALHHHLMAAAAAVVGLGAGEEVGEEVVEEVGEEVVEVVEVGVEVDRPRDPTDGLLNRVFNTGLYRSEDEFRARVASYRFFWGEFVFGLTRRGGDEIANDQK